MKKFLIGGTIVDNDSQKWSFEDVTPTEVKSAIKNLADNEPITFEITSAGGSCIAGIAIANLIREASLFGHKTTAHIIGLAASMASVIACAADVVQMDQSSFMMIHNPWTTTEGNADTLRKEADTLDKFKSALISFYRSKFDLTDDQISKMMDDETWFTGGEAENFHFACDVIPSKQPLRAAACAKQIPIFNNLPNNAKSLMRLSERATMNEEGNDKESIESAVEALSSDAGNALSAEPAEDGQPEQITKAEADLRVSGMQSKMAKQMDALRKDYEDRISGFQDQLKAKDAELTEAKSQVISLTQKLEETSGELQKTASALEEKETALAKLNADVNTPNEELPTLADGLAKCITPSEKSAFIKSGKYKH